MKATHNTSNDEPPIPHEHFIPVEHTEESIYIILWKKKMYQLERVRN
jgi:hypothetical protein